MSSGPLWLKILLGIRFLAVQHSKSNLKDSAAWLSSFHIPCGKKNEMKCSSKEPLCKSERGGGGRAVFADLQRDLISRFVSVVREWCCWAQTQGMFNFDIFGAWLSHTENLSYDKSFTVAHWARPLHTLWLKKLDSWNSLVAPAVHYIGVTIRRARENT